MLSTLPFQTPTLRLRAFFVPKELLLHMHRHFKASLLHRVSVRRGGHVELSARAASCVSQLVLFFCLRLELNRFVLCVCACVFMCSRLSVCCCGLSGISLQRI